MRTEHRILRGDARDLSALPDGSVHLVVTSPPYPLVAMWDGAFGQMSPAAAAALGAEDAATAFEAMHQQLDAVWAHCQRLLVDGGFLCVNIGDAARTVGGRFALWPNHARILTAALRLGLTVLPDVLWRKPSNAPNKFMGSGMLPAGAYVTYEHEYVLILRKGGPREMSAADRERRQRSAMFWEERNAWFSDLWSDLKGTRQELDRGTRERSGAFPVELPWRLIQMYSLYEDVVLDPFAGTGSTALAAAASGRSSVGVEQDPALVALARQRLAQAPSLGRERAEDRLYAHRELISARLRAGKEAAHHNAVLDVPVITSQECQLTLLVPRALSWTEEGATVEHGPPPPPAQAALPFA